MNSELPFQVTMKTVSRAWQRGVGGGAVGIIDQGQITFEISLLFLSNFAMLSSFLDQVDK